jgi:HD-GYP domain-containing protein (c-di-GMP phosphodiesterase class II)
MPAVPNNDALDDLHAELIALVARHRHTQAGGLLRDVGRHCLAPVTVEQAFDVAARLDVMLRQQAVAIAEWHALAARAVEHAAAADASAKAAQAQDDARFDKIVAMAGEFADKLDAATARQNKNLLKAKAARNAARDHRRASVRSAAEDVRRRVPYTLEHSTRWLAEQVARQLGLSVETVRDDLDALRLK